ncbi:YciI family protein [Crossiella sp. CA-258035]|uniref:YciI family protein n=1 Tax=Crossiella sp. CA-258035 TaxID=2981138 RepID=UPI0024BBECB8|nr:YciI family protein [Crossiella sp. CA-258035]WHT22410.1 YciI family protein [Crossiella sp. CA-258035]
MAQYLLSIYQPDGPTPPPEFLDPVMKRLDAVNADMIASGARVFAAGLFPPSTATVIRANGDEVLMTDGPFTEGKEHIGGFTVIQVEDLDAALHWGRRLAEAIGLPIEVRPMYD